MMSGYSTSKLPSDMEGNTNKNFGGDDHNQDDLLNSVYNEMYAMKSSFRSVRCKLTLMLGVVLLVALLGVAGSFAALKHSKTVTVDENTYRLTTKDKKHSVGTVGVGQVFKLPLYSFPIGSYENINTSAPNPYVCVGVNSVVDIWRSTMFGVQTNIVVYGAFEGHYHAEDVDVNSAGYGATLAWQGSTQNRTHACLYTANTHLQLCVDFANTICGTGNGVKDVSMHFNQRRQLFDELVFGGDGVDGIAADTAAEGDGVTVFDINDNGHGHRNLQSDCSRGHWCQDYAALVLVGKW